MLKSSLIVAVCMLIGRLLGFVRELVLANVTGASSTSDLVILSFTLPDLIITLFIGGAANIVFVPYFQGLEAGKRVQYYLSLSILFFIIFVLISILFFIFNDTIISLLAPGIKVLSKDKIIFYLSTISIPIIAIASISRAYLHSVNRFFSSSIENIIFNFFLIFGLILFLPNREFIYLGMTIFFGAFARFLVQFFDIYKFQKENNLFYSNISLFKIHIASIIKDRIFKKYTEALVAGIILILFPVILRSFFSSFGPGYLSIFNYAQKLFELPVGILFASFSIVFLPTVSTLVKKIRIENNPELERLLSRVYTIVTLLSVVTLYVSLLLIFETQILSKIFNLTSDSINIFYVSTGVMFLALPFRAISTLNFSVLGAYGETKILMIINLISSFLVVIFGMLSLYFNSWVLIPISLSLFYIFVFIGEILYLYNKKSLNILMFVGWRKIFYFIIFNSIFYLCFKHSENYFQNISQLFSFLIMAVIAVLSMLYFQRKEIKNLLRKHPF